MSDTNTYNGQPPAFYPTPMLVADYVAYAGGSVDSVPPMTTAVNVTSGLTVPVTACREDQSAVGAYLMPRLTTTALSASTFTLVPGMIAYNSTVNCIQSSQAAITGGTANNFTPLSTFTKSGVLTPAQFIAIFATPVSVIPSPGAAGLIIIRSFYLELVWTALNAQYTTGGPVSLQYGTTAQAGGTLATATIAAAGINGATSSLLFTAATAAPANTNAVATFANLPISLSCSGAAFAAGNSPIKYYIEYSIMPL